MIAGNNLGKQSDLLIRLKEVSVKLHTFSRHVFEEQQYSQKSFYVHVVQKQELKEKNLALRTNIDDHIRFRKQEVTNIDAEKKLC